jgi:RNA-directed DNA polymerase
MARNGFEMVRYANDFVVLCASQEEAQKAFEEINQWVEENGLKLHPTKTRIVDASQRGGFDFLGYHFERGKKCTGLPISVLLRLLNRCPSK